MIKSLASVLLVIVAACGAPAAAAASGEGWYRVRSEHFNILSNGDVREVQKLARDLEIFRQGVILLTGVTRTAKHDLPFTIVAPRSRSEFRRIFDDKRAVGVFAANLAGMYAVVDMSSRGYQNKGTRERNVEEVLNHEYVHFFLRNNSTVRYPYWYEEGFAEFLSTLTYENGTLTIGYPVADRHLTIGASLMGRLPSLEALLTSTRRDPKVSMDMIYAGGWLLVHHLNTEPDLAKKVPNFLSLYNASGDSLAAFNATFDVDLGALRRQLDNKVRRGKYHYITYRPKQSFSGSTAESTALSRPEALLELAQAMTPFANAKGDFEEIERLYQETINLVPGSIAALSGLAGIALKQGELSRAVDYVARLPSAADDALALIAMGDVALAQGVAEASDPGAVKLDRIEEARKYYIDALRLDPNLAPALYGYGLSYFGLPETDLGEPLKAFRQLYRLLPSLPEVVCLRALLLLQAGEHEEARGWAEEALRLSDSKWVIGLATAVAVLAEAENAGGGRVLAFDVVKRWSTGRGEL